MAETWLRIVTYKTTRGSSEARTYITDGLQDVLRKLGGTPGFRGGHWAHDQEGLTIAAVTNWSSREAIESTGSYLKQLRGDRLAHGLTLGKEVNLQLVTSPTSWDPADWTAITSRNASNWMRVAFYDNAKDPAAVEHLRTSTGDALDVLKKQDGFRVGYWGHDSVEGTAAAVTYWDGLEYIEKASGELATIHADRKAHGSAIADVLNLQLLHTELVGEGAKGWMPLPKR
jgi:hypothetical protein